MVILGGDYIPVLQMEIIKLLILGKEYQKNVINIISITINFFFQKLQGPVTLISIFQGPKFKRTWQAQFLSHTLAILGNDASFIDLQMILVPFLSAGSC